jgi:hypothetical protein
MLQDEFSFRAPKKTRKRRKNIDLLLSYLFFAVKDLKSSKQKVFLSFIRRTSVVLRNR